jgi:hypothetical protein
MKQKLTRRAGLVIHAVVTQMEKTTGILVQNVNILITAAMKAAPPPDV